MSVYTRKIVETTTVGGVVTRMVTTYTVGGKEATAEEYARIEAEVDAEMARMERDMTDFVTRPIREAFAGMRWPWRKA